MLEVRGVRHDYAGQTAVAVDEWTAGADEQWLIHGPSGCGKTTLLHIVGGLLAPGAGEIRIDGQELTALSDGARDRFRGRNVGIVFQRLHLIDALTVRQNLTLARSLAGLDIAGERIEGILDELGIAEKGASHPHALSHGEAQRVALARALINDPKLVLADEPTSSLDDDNAARAIAMLRERAAARGALLVVASHDRRLAESFAHRLDLPAEATA